MDHLIYDLAVSLAIGLVVGLERGWREREEAAGLRTAGIRTYALIGLLGGVSAALARTMAAPALLIVTGLATTAVFAAFKYREMARVGDYSVTGIIAAILVFSLGALAVVGETSVAAATGIATAGLLAAREGLHRMLRHLTWPELRSALVLLGMTVIVLPLLPNRAIDPFGAINPRQLWLFMVLTATISFAGYVAVKMAGSEKGILISAVGGGLVSSTAVTIAFARRAAMGQDAGLLAGGAAVAAMVSVLRVMAICAVVAPGVLPMLIPPAGAGALALGCVGAVLMRRAAVGGGAPVPDNPFELTPLAAFVILFGIVSAISGFLLKVMGPNSLYLVSAVAGIIETDVPTLNAARLAGTELTMSEAALCILIALGVNAVSRVAFAAAAGPSAFWLRLAVATGCALAAMLAALLLVAAM